MEADCRTAESSSSRAEEWLGDTGALPKQGLLTVLKLDKCMRDLPNCVRTVTSLCQRTSRAARWQMSLACVAYHFHTPPLELATQGLSILFGHAPEPLLVTLLCGQT